MSLLTVFKSQAPTMGYVFKSGKTVHFVNHIYATAAKDEIEELTTECQNGHPNYYIDSEMTQVDSAQLNPMEVLRAQIRAEERAALLAATNPSRDMGQTEQGGKLEGIANSVTITGLAASSEAQATAARVIIPAAKATATKV